MLVTTKHRGWRREVSSRAKAVTRWLPRLPNLASHIIHRKPEIRLENANQTVMIQTANLRVEALFCMVQYAEIYRKLEQELGINLPVVEKHERFSNLRNLLKQNGSYTIFGAGGAGRQLASWLRERGAKVHRFLDNNVALNGSELDGAKVFTPDALGKNGLKEEPILVASMYFTEISQQLTADYGLISFRDFFVPHLFLFEVNIMGQGYNAELIEHLDRFWDDILKTAALWADGHSRWRFFRYLYLRLYFLTPERMDKNFLKLSCREHVEGYKRLDGLEDPLKKAALFMLQNELYTFGGNHGITVCQNDIVVDGGAWLGDSTLSFALKAGPKGQVWAFEPQTEHGENLKKTAKIWPCGDRIHVELCGLWSSTGILKFTDSQDYHGAGSFVSDMGSIEIPVKCLDDFLNGKKVDFLKLDIEGSELEALKGAEQTLRRWRPKLAICLYHQPSDLHQIPLYLNSLNLGYHFYFDHQGEMPTDAVLFARAPRPVGEPE